MENYEPLLNIEELLLPISEECPAGEDLRFSETYDAIKEAMREDDDFADTINGDIKAADYERVYGLSHRALTDQSKDLQVAVWLVNAFVREAGLPALRDGMNLIRELMSRYWATMFPEMEDGDLEARANALAWLDRQLGPTISTIPMTDGPGGKQYSYAQWQDSERFKIPEPGDGGGYEDQKKIEELKARAEEEKKITSEQWRVAKTTTKVEFFKDFHAQLAQCWDAYKALDRVVDELFGRHTPGLNTLKKSLEGMMDLTTKILRERGALESNAPAPAAQKTEDGPIAGQPGGGYSEAIRYSAGPETVRGPVNSREAALKLLVEASTYFKRAEPHSPVSYLVDRAVRWAGMSLEEWLKEMLKDEGILGPVRETLGLANQDMY